MTGIGRPAPGLSADLAEEDVVSGAPAPTADPAPARRQRERDAMHAINQDTAPLFVRSTDSYDGPAWSVVCPQCGSRPGAVFNDADGDCAHLSSVVVTAPTGHVRITGGADGNAVETYQGEATPPSLGRGTAVNVWFTGECGHVWVLSLAFHKGATRARVYVPDAAPSELWRD